MTIFVTNKSKHLNVSVFSMFDLLRQTKVNNSLTIHINHLIIAVYYFILDKGSVVLGHSVSRTVNVEKMVFFCFQGV